MSLPASLIEAVPAPGSPYHGRAGHQLALRDIALEIRARVPISGEVAVDAECSARRALVEEALAALGVDRGPRQWWTLVCEQSPDERMPVFAGIWAHSMEEAIIETCLWRAEFDNRHIFSCDPDERCAYHAKLSDERRALELRDARAVRREAELEAAVTLW